MPFWVLFGIAIGLGLDAFAVAIASGVKLCRVSPWQMFRMSGAFGLFQFAMPVLGWLAGSTLVNIMQAWDQWIAFSLLALVGGHMVWGGMHGGEEAKAKPGDPTIGWTLLILAIATSLDALVVGLSFSMLKLAVFWPSMLIGVVAAGMTALGMKIGCRVGMQLGRRMEIVGGLILIALGIKILFGHIG